MREVYLTAEAYVRCLHLHKSPAKSASFCALCRVLANMPDYEEEEDDDDEDFPTVDPSIDDVSEVWGEEYD